MTIKAHRGKVLKTSIDVVDYDEAVSRVDGWAFEKGVKLVAAANTHLVAEAAHDSEFARTLESFDMVVPDGMPLVWALRLNGWNIHERVYGPYLMARCVEGIGVGVRHAFVGGTEECLSELVEAVKVRRPDIQIAGVISPPFRAWDEEWHQSIVEGIVNLQANVIWLALGGVKQETWLVQNKDRLPNGVYLAVGDAFVLLAGKRSYAPNWMQRVGLTWLYRLIQEPRRLAGRYLSYNVRFVMAFLRERWELAHGRGRLRE